jgi:ketosteroid isomerase-like protein
MAEATQSGSAAEVFAAEEQRNEALAIGDWPRLEAMLDDDLVFTHLSGRTEDKAAYLARATTRKHASARSSLQVRVIGDVAIMTGGVAFGEDGKTPVALPPEGFVLQVWVKRERGWLLTALQATRISPPTA